MEIDKYNIIRRFLAEKASLIYIEINSEGVITESNNFTDKLTGKKLKGENISELIIDFAGSFNITSILERKEDKTLLNIKTAAGLPATYDFTFGKTESGYMAIGERSYEEMENLQKNVIELYRESINNAREIQKKSSLLERMNQEKNYFMGIVAHDLRNPAGIITGFADLLMESLNDRLDEDEKKSLEIIHSTGDYMLKLLNDLLDFTKIESGKYVPDYKETDLQELISKNVILNNIFASKKNISVKFTCGEKPEFIKLDALKIEQVLNNLISNAIKYSPPDTEINISLTSENGNIKVSISDQGQGIPENEIPKVFKAFETTSVKSTSGEKSTGLGLSIVQKIITAHKGRVWVESALGIGSTFYFTIPME